MTNIQIIIFFVLIIASNSATWEIKDWKDGIKAAELEEAQQQDTIKAQNKVISQNKDSNAITNEVSNDYQAKIAAFDKLYSDAIGMPPASNSTSGSMSNIPNAIGGFDATPCDNRLHGRNKTTLLMTSKVAQKQAEQLAKLQSWIIEQKKVYK